MADVPPPSRLQFHLSTAIVMMIVAGGIIGANFRGEITQTKSSFNPKDSAEIVLYKDFGWPEIVLSDVKFIGYDVEGSDAKLVPGNGEWHARSLYHDICFIILMPFFMGVACEWVMLIRASRKKA